MAHEAQDFVRANFSRDRMCTRTMAVYREVLGEAGWTFPGETAEPG